MTTLRYLMGNRVNAFNFKADGEFDPSQYKIIYLGCCGYQIVSKDGSNSRPEINPLSCQKGLDIEIDRDTFTIDPTPSGENDALWSDQQLVQYFTDQIIYELAIYN